LKLLVANRGEIAVRIMRACNELGIKTVAVFSKDDSNSIHIRKADEVKLLQGIGAEAYLNIEQIIGAAKEFHCDAIHPGYGFLSENARFAKSCEQENIIFVGPDSCTLELFGNKARARGLATNLKVPVLKGSNGPVSLNQAKDFMLSLKSGDLMMIKAVAGGGGRGIRIISHISEIDEAYERCKSEAITAFGNGDLYVEQLMLRVRHIEVQIIGDGSGNVSHIGERECSIQRQYQKLIEIAPCPGLSSGMRRRITADAVRMAKEVNFKNLGTFEFLVEQDAIKDNAYYAFIEANPRLQVEHTVTEEVADIDLVKIQLQIATGKSLMELGLDQANIPKPQGYAIEARINMEIMDAKGTARPSGGAITIFEAPSGRGIRTDTCGYAGFRSNPNFDSLLAKLIGHSVSQNFSDTVLRTYRALCEFRVEGVKTNISFLQNLLRHPDFLANNIYTGFVEDHISELVKPDIAAHQKLFFDSLAPKHGAGVKVDEIDPLAVLAYGKTGETYSSDIPDIADTTGYLPPYPNEESEQFVVIKSLMQGTIVSIDIKEGDLVRKGQQIMIMNSMKMEHVIRSETAGIVVRIEVAQGDAVYEGHPLVYIEPGEDSAADFEESEFKDLDYIREDLKEVKTRHEITLDTARPDKVEKRRKRRQRTARENINDICDPGTFIEYGALVIAGQRQRRTIEDLVQNTPTDGLIAGIGTVNGKFFDDEKARCILMSYDYMVLAGTQGMKNHYKKDRMFELAEGFRLPIVFFTEGGGGRPGDTDGWGVAGLDCMAFHLFGKLSGLVPLVGVNSGRCFAGNAALLGCCDVVIATANSNIGMGGPAMIEGGGLGVFRPEEVGPMNIQVPNGVVDIPVADEAEAVHAAKQYLSYFQGPIKQWECEDQRLLRRIIPENRLRIYEVRSVIETLADKGSVLELRRHFGLGMVTSFIRIEGHPLGVIANNPRHLSGAIDSPGADKAARFMQLCDAFDIPILFLCDTPGIMVGPEIEKTALVRHCCRMFVTGGSLTVPYFTIVLRKSYGLGAQAMGGGSHRAPMFVISWPTGEFGGMGLEGAVKLGYRKELAAIEDPEKRKELFDHMVAQAYEHGKAINTASHFEIDDVIDPADSRFWIMRALKSAPPSQPRKSKKRPCVDTW
jgi:acetyl/propionyl-CoA carboxylase alpha subunit/acetyl-CoA carboxylase carboxyltransferase component